MIFQKNYKVCLCLIMGLVFLASACSKESLRNEGTDPPLAPEDRVYVGLYTQTDDFQQPASKAVNESAVDGSLPWVFVFSGTTGTATFFEVKQATLVGGTPYVGLQHQSTAVTVWVLANAPASFSDGGSSYAFSEANLTTRFTSRTLSDVQNSLKTVDISSVTSIPYDGGHLPMAGQTTLPNISASITIGTSASKIQLSRVVAKVSIHSTAANFTLINWTVVGTRSATNFLVPGVTGVSLQFNEGLALPTDAFYIYPSAAGEATVILKGSYYGTVYYYKLGFKSSNADDLPVARNHWYQFTISSVTGPGYATFTEAVLSAPLNILSEISVIELFSYDMQDNGLYYIGVNNSQLLYYGLPNGTTRQPYTVLTTAVTSATAAMVGGVNSVSLENVNPPGSMTIIRTSLFLPAAAGGLAFSNIDINTLQSSFLSADVLIRLGNLSQVIEVRKASNALPAAASVSHLNYEGNIYTSAKLLLSNATWLSLATDALGTNNVGSSYTQANAGALTPVYLCTQSNAGAPLATARYTELMLSRQAQGLTKVYVVQDVFQ